MCSLFIPISYNLAEEKNKVNKKKLFLSIKIDSNGKLHYTSKNIVSCNITCKNYKNTELKLGQTHQTHGKRLYEWTTTVI